MAPQRETAELFEDGTTFYGALEMKNSSKDSASGSKTLVAVALVAAALVGTAFALYTPAEHSAASVAHVTAAMPVGDDLKDGHDCECAPGEACAAISGKAYGECKIRDQTAPVVCNGFDYEPAYTKSVGGSDVWHAHCQYVQGKYDCYKFPCQNGGFCLDGSDAYTCVCPFGYEGKDCENEIDECSEQGEYQVCHEYATCSNAEGSYACTCNPGDRKSTRLNSSH